MGSLYNTRILVGEWKMFKKLVVRDRNSRFVKFFSSISSNFGRRVGKRRRRCIWCVEKTYHVAKANLQPHLGKSRGACWDQIDTNKYLPLISAVFIWWKQDTCMDVAWRGWSNSNASTSSLILPWSKHLSLQDLSSYDWLDGTSCFDRCRLANSIFHQISQAPGRTRLFVLA